MELLRLGTEPRSRRKSGRFELIVVAARILILLCAVTTGCAAYPKLTAEHAARCVPLTFAYRNMTRDVAGPIKMEVDEGDPDFIELHVIGEPGRLGTFRVWSDRRMEMWDWTRGEWVAVGVCD